MEEISQTCNTSRWLQNPSVTRLSPLTRWTKQLTSQRLTSHVQRLRRHWAGQARLRADMEDYKAIKKICRIDEPEAQELSTTMPQSAGAFIDLLALLCKDLASTAGSSHSTTGWFMNCRCLLVNSFNKCVSLQKVCTRYDVLLAAGLSVKYLPRPNWCIGQN